MILSRPPFVANYVKIGNYLIVHLKKYRHGLVAGLIFVQNL